MCNKKKTFFLMMVHAERPQELQCFHFSNPNLDYSSSASGHSDDLIFTILKKFFSRILWTSVSKWHRFYSMAKKPQALKCKAILFFLIAWQAWRGGGGGVQWVHLHPLTGTRGPFFLLISDLKQSEVGVLLYNSIYWLCSKIENAVKKVTSLTHSFHKTCFSLCKV